MRPWSRGRKARSHPTPAPTSGRPSTPESPSTPKPASAPEPATPSAGSITGRPTGPVLLTRASGRSRLLAVLWVLVTVVGAAMLVVGVLGTGPWRLDPVPLGPFLLDPDSPWLPRIGAVVVATTYVWALAARTGGRPVVFGLLTAAAGGVVLGVDHEVLRNGAAVMTCVVSAVLAIVATVPAVKLWHAVREVLVAALVAGLGALATVGLGPTIDPVRFDYVTLGLAMVASFGVVYRLGAGFHGVGRRGVFIVIFGAVVLGLTLAYAELLRRYGTPVLVEWLFDGIRWLRSHLGASPRPLVALLGVPALLWGTHMRARRRQGWWVCAFGVCATVPFARMLVDPSVARAEAGLAMAYGLAVGLLVGYLVIRIDLLLTGKRGRRGRRAEEKAAVRPEPARLEALL